MRLTRRQWSLLLGISPLAAQSVPPTTADKAPPVGPAPASLQKAMDDIHQVSTRLAGLEVPMNIEPAFAFKP